MGFSQSVPAADDRRFYVAAWDNTLYAIEAATGEFAWQAGCCDDMSFLYSCGIASPALAHGCVYAVANGNRLYCFDKETGEKRWVYSSPRDKVGYSSPRIDGTRIYVGCLGDIGEARCVNALSGDEIWVCTVRDVIYDSSPAILPRHVAVGSVSGKLNLINKITGDLEAEWRLPTGHCLASPAASGNMLFLASYSNRVFGFRVG